MHREVSPQLQQARRLLEDISGYELVEDFSWEEAIGQWSLLIRITMEFPATDFVPKSTDWRVLIDEHYPLGAISFMPAADRGIKSTFQHQLHNGQRVGSRWRDGKICLDGSLGSWGRKKYSSEPWDARNRLRWHVYRCISWVSAAATGTLTELNDPMELPDFDRTTAFRIVYSEDETSFGQWSHLPNVSGLFSFIPLGQNPEIYVVTDFEVQKEDLRSQNWGRYIREYHGEKQRRGIWLMLPEMPVLPPWQVPETFDELISICEANEVDFRAEVLKNYTRIRQVGSVPKIIMIGFPLPRFIGKEKELIHWFALEIPIPPKSAGFRNNSFLWEHQVNLIFGKSKKIQWMKSDNWHREQLTNRGKVSGSLIDSKILFIGAGAVGSTLAELFARLGCGNLTFVDFDFIQPGNLSRHILTLKEVGNNKADAVSKYLNSIFPFLECKSEQSSIDSLLSKEPSFLDRFDIVIDATAVDEVIELIAKHISPSTAHFFSVSTGYNADKLYCYHCSNGNFENLLEDFNSEIAQHVEADSQKIEGTDEIVEGIGCWHPLFPARIDDIQMLVGAAFKVIERKVTKEGNARMTIIEKEYEQDNFLGIRIKPGKRT